jgi:Raf kinase inhibitor-like YbhB/YbcL family protein
MRRIQMAVVAALAALAAGAGAAEPQPLTVSSSAFTDGGAIPTEYTCEGKSTPPPLSWSSLPAGTKSVVVLVEDPDAPGGTYDHLALFNLPATQQSLPTAALESLGQPGSSVASARNSGGKSGFAPICPPSGKHRYRFIVSALDTTLPLPPSSAAPAVKTAMTGHVIARGQLVGTYQPRR